MTNFEKFSETFGFAPNTGNCLTNNPCIFCPISDVDIYCTIERKENWWNSEYKEAKNETDN